MRCGYRTDFDGLARDCDQLWAEALVRHGRSDSNLEIDFVTAAPKVVRLGDVKDAVTIMKIYVNSNCEVGDAHQVEKDELYFDHCAWRAACGLEPVNKQWFGRLLRAACPGRENYRSGDDVRCQKYRGLRLR